LGRIEREIEEGIAKEKVEGISIVLGPTQYPIA
jgi:hypothetical protein